MATDTVETDDDGRSFVPDDAERERQVPGNESADDDRRDHQVGGVYATGAKWGANVKRRRATHDQTRSSISAYELLSIYSTPHRPTARSSMASRGSALPKLSVFR